MSGLERVVPLLSGTGRDWEGPSAPDVDPHEIGATDGGRWTSEDGELEATVYVFGSQSEHPGAVERLQGLGLPADPMLPWGSNGGLLYRAAYVGDADGAGQGVWDAMDVLSALAGGE